MPGSSGGTSAMSRASEHNAVAPTLRSYCSLSFVLAVGSLVKPPAFFRLRGLEKLHPFIHRLGDALLLGRHCATGRGDSSAQQQEADPHGGDDGTGHGQAPPAEGVAILLGKR